MTTGLKAGGASPPVGLVVPVVEDEVSVVDVEVVPVVEVVLVVVVIVVVVVVVVVDRSTVTNTVSEAVRPPRSLTTSVKLYTPGLRPSRETTISEPSHM